MRTRAAKAREGQARKYGIGHSVADYREMLGRPDLDAVDIAVPHHLHCPMTLDALSQGLHVICEKPIGLDLDEADRMIEAASRSKGRLLIKQYQRCAEHHTRAKEIIDSGELGDVYLMTGLFLAQLSEAENDPGNWRGTWDRAGGGILIDGGVHVVDLMQFILGRAVAVSATAKRLVAGLPHKADDTTSLTIEYERGAIGSVVCASCDTSHPRPDPGQGLLRHPGVAPRVAGRPSDQADPLDGRGIGGDHRGRELVGGGQRRGGDPPRRLPRRWHRAQREPRGSAARPRDRAGRLSVLERRASGGDRAPRRALIARTTRGRRVRPKGLPASAPFPGRPMHRPPPSAATRR